MKKKLLSLILPMLFLTVVVQAQTKVWDFGNDITNWPINDGVTSVSPATDGSVTIDELTLVPHTSSTSLLGQIQSSSKTWPDTYSAVNRFKFNGGGGVDPAMGEYTPAVRYLTFLVTGAGEIKVWFRSGSNSVGSTRTIYVTDGTQILGSYTAVEDTDPYILTADYTGGTGTIYIFGDNSFNLGKIETTTPLLGANDFASPVSTNVKAIGNRIYVSNVKSSTEVNIYSITGALVKSFKTNNDIDFEFNSGLYIATVKTIEGQKSVKLLTQ